MREGNKTDDGPSFANGKFSAKGNLKQNKKYDDESHSSESTKFLQVYLH